MSYIFIYLFICLFIINLFVYLVCVCSFPTALLLNDTVFLICLRYHAEILRLRRRIEVLEKQRDTEAIEEMQKEINQLTEKLRLSEKVLFCSYLFVDNRRQVRSIIETQYRKASEEVKKRAAVSPVITRYIRSTILSM